MHTDYIWAYMAVTVTCQSFAHCRVPARRTKMTRRWRFCRMTCSWTLRLGMTGMGLTPDAWVIKHCIYIKGTPGYKNKLILIDSQWLVKTNGATCIFIEKLVPKFLPVQFWPCLSFTALSPNFLSCGPKFRPFYRCDMKLCCDGVATSETRFECVSSAVTAVEDHAFQFKNIS